MCQADSRKTVDADGGITVDVKNLVLASVTVQTCLLVVLEEAV